MKRDWIPCPLCFKTAHSHLVNMKNRAPFGALFEAVGRMVNIPQR